MCIINNSVYHNSTNYRFNLYYVWKIYKSGTNTTLVRFVPLVIDHNLGYKSPTRENDLPQDLLASENDLPQDSQL